MTNGSLYICIPEALALDPADTINSLREASLWSAEAPKQVRPDQRNAYKTQLEFVEAIEYAAGVGNILLVRCTHPKYPSDANRWASWLQLLDNLYQRI